ncbi:NAD-dependent epimerase/dehydratase family protein [Taibaiella soli]|uniref:NAD-dependent epimerase/dehydratase domain-containing protein n=1 Tax=Taibaiella soli TaxID=1649169 RepID=A0A2W2ALL2_9BACT|nr:NAD-dependent epimerase/dehydratase family protein [Taibaiella soli]PZF73210.1 hypothetical protein DN068_10090 [Taibaiella soli]
MVVGNGMIARKFRNYEHQDHFIIFASGVSNSKNTDQNQYLRERELLAATIQQNPQKRLLYFSTCSVYDPAEEHSLYVKHKKEMEALIMASQIPYLILRTSNVVGNGGNPNTIFNYFIHNINNDIHFDLWANAGRNFIDADDLFAITDYVLQEGLFQNQILNVANPLSISVKSIVHEMEDFLDHKANYTLVEKGSSPIIDLSAMMPIAEALQINFGAAYLSSLIKKYYRNA